MAGEDGGLSFSGGQARGASCGKEAVGRRIREKLGLQLCGIGELWRVSSGARLGCFQSGAIDR
jgi:hypothetical protein